MRKADLQAAEFTFRHEDSPLQPLQRERSQQSNGTAVAPTVLSYGVWRAPRSDGKECTVLVSEFDADDAQPSSVSGAGSDAATAPSGVALLLTLARHLSQVHGHSYFARDVIFVFVERGAARDTASRDWSKQRAVDGFGAWLRAYHSGDADLLRGGRILTVLALDIPLQRSSSPPYRSLSLDSVGYYGLMPNLDLPSMLLRVFPRSKVPLVVAESVLHQEEDQMQQQQQRVAAVATPSLTSSSIVNPLSQALATHAPFLRRSWFSTLAPNEHARVVNLDPYNVLTPALQAVLGPSGIDARWHLWDTNPARSKGLWRFMLQALQGGAQQYHAAPVAQYAIDAVTLRAIPQTRDTHGTSRKGDSETMPYDIMRSVLSGRSGKPLLAILNCAGCADAISYSVCSPSVLKC